MATVEAAALPNLTLSSPKRRVDSLLQHMWLLLAPSLWEEAWGMVVTEAMLRGLPVITSNLGEAAETRAPTKTSSRAWKSVHVVADSL